MRQKAPATLQQAVIYFADRDRCHEFATSFRWPDGKVTCPTCGSAEVAFLKSRYVWQCKARHPKSQFSAKVGTIFEDSPLPLSKWFPAIWQLANCKNGISSYELASAIGVTQKTAWFMLHRIRLAMQAGTFEKIANPTEADETFIGGLARFMHKDRRERKIKVHGPAGKAVVMGLLDRKTRKVRLAHVPNLQVDTLREQVRKHVAPGSELFTDEYVAYYGLNREYVHNVINHAEAYARDHVHTNGIENFWSLLKRGLKGTYISVEPFHLFRYLDEQAFRFNNRKLTPEERFSETLASVAGRRLTYRELTGKEAASAVAP